MNNDYKIELGIGLNTQEFNKIKNDIKSLEDKPIRLEIDAETKELTNTIKEALNSLSKGTKDTLKIDTSEIKKSLDGLSSIVDEIKRSLGTLDGGDMKTLVSSINQMAKALGKAENESDSLIKSLTALSKKDLSLNISLDMGKKNNNMIAYGRAARKQIIPELEAQVKELEALLGGQQATMKKLTSQGSKIGFDVFTDFNDFNSDSAIKKMEAMEKYVNSLKKLAAIDNIKLDGFNEIHKDASALINDITGVESAVDKADDVPEKIKRLFGGGIDAEGLSTSLKPITDNLNQIRDAIVNLSKGVSLEGLTQSFDRLSDSIENLLANAEKVKGILNSGFDVNGVGADINSIKTPKSTRRRTQSESDEYLNGYLKHWNINNKDDVKTVKAKFKAFSDVSSLGAGDKAYDTALDDLMSTLKQLGSVSKTADDDAKKLLATLKGYNIDAPKDKYKSEFGDDWKNIKNKHKILKSGTGVPVDVAYQELSSASGFSSYFPDDIWNEYDQLRKIIEVYDELERRSKNRKVNISDEYKDTDLRNQVFDIVSVMQEQSEAEQKVAQASTQSTNTISQNENQKQQKYEETKRKLDEVNRAVAEHKEVIEDPNKLTSLGDNALSYMDEYDDLVRQQKELESALKGGEKIEQSYRETSGVIENLKTTLQTMDFDNSSIDAVIRDLEEMGVEINKATAKMKDDKLDISIKGIDSAGRAIEVIRQFNIEYGEISTVGKTISQSISQSFKTSDDVVREVKQEMGELINLYKQISSMDVKIKTLEAQGGDADYIADLKRQLEGLHDAYAKLSQPFMKKLTSHSDIISLADVEKFYNEYNSITQNAQNKLRELDIKIVDESSARTIKELNNEMTNFVKLHKQIEEKKVKIGSLEAQGGSLNQIAELNRQLEELESTYEGLIHTFMKKLAVNADIMPTGDVAKFNDEIIAATQKTEDKLRELDAKYADTQAELARGIGVKLETGEFTTKVSKIESDAKKLSNTYEEVERGIEEVNIALRSMQSASADGDIEKLIIANKQYEDALKKVENQLKQNRIAEQNASAQQKLDDDIILFQTKIDSWLTKNSAATKQFGSAMLDLKAKAEKCDRTTLNHLESEFKQLDKAAEAAGKKTQTFGQSLKTQFSKYSSYFSIASLFMYVQQGLRSMFEQVKLIDSAMTELKKVTDETDASYNKFLSNAAKRSKELGTTIDGLVSSTADFARLGYGFEDAQGLAEVANIYAVVGDEIEGVEGATESLISTMAAFKDEMNGMSNTDFAMSIIDKFNEIGNNFAISSGGIGEALERSASSLMAANNTIDESIALITASNQVVQDPEAVGKWLADIKSGYIG